MHSNKILATRRTYNKLVANEMLEDFALRFTAKRARRWNMAWIANTALGTVSFLVLEALGGAITLNYGVINALWAIGVVSLVILFSGIPISYYAAKYGVDIDLLSRGAGFGYIGSTIASLIYASFTFIFFALEAAIMAMALQLLIGVPLLVGYVVSALIVIPLVTHGITNIGRFQQWSQPIWLAMQLVPLYFVFTHPDSQFNEWINYAGLDESNDNSFNFVMFGAACAVLLSVVAQIGEQVDFLRFMPEPTKKSRLRWWTALLLGGPGWILVGAPKMILGSFLAYLALAHGLPALVADDPAHMYMVVFNYVTDNKGLALFLAASFVIVSQLKINVANAYAGSLAWSNYFSRITHSHPGRVVWVVFNVVIALLLMVLGVYQALEEMLQIYSVLVLGWIGAIVADLIINKPLGLSPKHIEFKRSQLYDINPVGVGSMLLASIIGIMGHLSLFGELFKAMASFVAFLLPFITVPLFAWLTKSKFYLARPAELFAAELETCSVCELQFEREDMTHCPAYNSPICSLCCSLDVRCGNKCRPHATLTAQSRQFAGRFLSPAWVEKLGGSMGQFVLVMLAISSVMSAILTLAYAQVPEALAADGSVATAFIKAFFLLLILIGVVSWLFILARSSSRVAMQEVQSQSELLSQEIDAHEETYRALQRAKETAETANQAKSRYLAGISHELRTPLNVLLGYAQLLSKDNELSTQKREYAAILRRNGEHLSDLIEGLLEISKIEAGRLELQRDDVQITEFLNQLVDMFQLQAVNKGIQFDYQPCRYLPEFIAADKQRLRQILMNLLSNAIKFTKEGSVSFIVNYRNEVAHFHVKDSGIGIDEADRELIFRPFERVRNLSTQAISGTGLGLTISRSLAELMGGNIDFKSTLEVGSEFTLSLMLPQVARPNRVKLPDANVIGYQGDEKTLLVVDDESSQRQLMKDILEPLGFVLYQAANATEALALCQHCPVDLFLLDVAMPEISGWQLAIQLRKQGFTQPIMMVSANTLESEHDNLLGQYHNDYLTKPVELNTLLGKIGRLLNLNWQIQDTEKVDDEQSNTAKTLNTPDLIPASKYLKELKNWAEIGYLSAFSDSLGKLEQQQIAGSDFIHRMRQESQRCDFEKIVTYLEALIDE
ncbi:hybrid sensor histidine kinase/response regulator [Corallincola spongiicola]|uniref:histidine kinase n=1 Tax=Corallincola spongiicola TaxID=2520508 RepID=A0ABY1WML0_9GAMM|nr:ATP-binding protein [Corallincola spongiicola]TAA43664.1 response regulator [Corallincola spongiicola]